MENVSFKKHKPVLPAKQVGQVQGTCSSPADRSTLLWVQLRAKIVIADTTPLDQDGRGGHSEQPIVDIPEATKDM